MSRLARTPSIRNRRDHHDYWLAPTFRASGGRSFRRLPDRTLVYADQYEERLREYEERPKLGPVARPAGASKFYSE